MIYKANKGQVSYGEAVGIILLDTYTPFIPGDVGNATTFNFPVRYRVIKNYTIERIFNKDKTGLDDFMNAGKELVKDGVKAITGDCGYMALFQQDLTNELNVPVFLSSLLQVPFISSIIGSNHKVGIICANSAMLNQQLLDAVGINPSTPHFIKGLEGKPHFFEAAIKENGTLDSRELEREVVSIAREMVKEEPLIKAILLECSLLPPYGAAVHQAVNLPVFDYVTMINFVYSAVIKKKFSGFM